MNVGSRKDRKVYVSFTGDHKKGETEVAWRDGYDGEWHRITYPAVLEKPELARMATLIRATLNGDDVNPDYDEPAHDADYLAWLAKIIEHDRAISPADWAEAKDVLRRSSARLREVQRRDAAIKGALEIVTAALTPTDDGAGGPESGNCSGIANVSH